MRSRANSVGFSFSGIGWPKPMEEAEDIGRSGLLVRRSCPSATLGQLLSHVGDVRRSDFPDSSPPHHVLELGAMGSPPGSGNLIPSPLHFVLSFTDLTYSVKNPKKLSLFPSSFRKNRLSEDPVSAGKGPEALSRTKTLLDSISGEAREGEILAVLGASGSGKSTLIDALPRTLSGAKKRARVEVLIDQLGLRRAPNTIIGDEGHRGVSSGERHRVSIGMDIIHDPIVLFLDEPSSGLDSTSTFMVVKVLQRIA